MSEATWKRRFRAPVVMFPTWAREKPDRLLYLSNAGGKFEVYAWDKATGERRQVTDRSEGTGYRVSSRLDPQGEWIWWFDDEKGNELGRWVREPWRGGTRETIAPQLAPAYSGRIAIHSGADDRGGFAVIGRSRSDEGSSVYVARDGDEPRRIYAHEQSAFIDGLSRDGTLVALFHSENGDSRNRELRIIDLEGRCVAELSHGAGHGLSPSGGWSPVAGDARYLAVHDREDLERPLIFDAKAGTSNEIRLDLPGETFADWYPDARSLLIGHDHRGRTELYRYDLASAKLERLATEPGTISTARVRPDGEVWYMLDRSSEPAAVRKVGGGVVLAGSDAPKGVAYRDADVDGVHVFVAEPNGEGTAPDVLLHPRRSRGGGPRQLLADRAGLGRPRLRRRLPQLPRLERLRQGVARRDRRPSRASPSSRTSRRCTTGRSRRSSPIRSGASSAADRGAAISRSSASARSPSGGRSASASCRSATTSRHTRTRWSRSRSTTRRSSAARRRRCPSAIGSRNPITYIDTCARSDAAARRSERSALSVTQRRRVSRPTA